MTPASTADDHLAEIARAVGYNDGAGWPGPAETDTDTGVDSLIAYKDALEEEVTRLRERAEAWDAVDAVLRGELARNPDSPEFARAIRDTASQQQHAMAQYQVGTDDVPRDVYDPHRDDAP